MYKVEQEVIPCIRNLDTNGCCEKCGLGYSKSMLRYNFRNGKINRIICHEHPEKENERYLILFTNKYGEGHEPSWKWCRHMLKPKSNSEAIDNNEEKI